MPLLDYRGYAPRPKTVYTSLSLFLSADSPHAAHPSTFSQLFPAETLRAVAHVGKGHRKTVTDSAYVSGGFFIGLIFMHGDSPYLLFYLGFIHEKSRRRTAPLYVVLYAHSRFGRHPCYAAMGAKSVGPGGLASPCRLAGASAPTVVQQRSGQKAPSHCKLLYRIGFARGRRFLTICGMP